MKRIRQFRYYGNNAEKNSPRYGDVFFKGNWFQDLGAVSHLGVQAMPGVRFSLNNSSSSISVGQTGIYELDLGDLGIIQSFKLDFSSLQGKEDQILKYGIVVDVIYEGA